MADHLGLKALPADFGKIFLRCIFGNHRPIYVLNEITTPTRLTEESIVVIIYDAKEESKYSRDSYEDILAALGGYGRRIFAYKVPSGKTLSPFNWSDMDRLIIEYNTSYGMINFIK